MSENYPSDWQLAKYQIQSEIGRGGMGAVYRGYDALLDRHVAVKVLAPHLAWEKEFVERFLREARTAAQLNHPAIVTIYDVGHEEGWYYFVMEYLEGHTLSQLIQEQGPLPHDKVISLLRPLAEALDYAHHQGLIHRDVKPGNIIITAKGAVKLTDFGMARALQRMDMTETGTIVGTPKYMSPEQAKGKKATAYSDQYSLAMVAYEMLCGQLPFEAETTMALLFKVAHEAPTPIRKNRPGLPAGVDIVLKQALAKDPHKRFKTTTEFVGTLERALSETPTQAEAFAQLVESTSPPPEPGTVEAYETATAQSPPFWKQVPLWGWGLAGLAALLLIVTLIVTGVGQAEDSPGPSPTPKATTAVAAVQTPQSTQATPTPPLSPLSTPDPGLSTTASPPPSQSPTPGATGAQVWARRGPQLAASQGQAPQVFQLAIDPNKPQVVYAGTNQGVYRSPDGGESWEARNLGLGDYNGLVVSALALDSNTPQTLVIGTWGDGLFRSDDGGTRWSRLADPLAPDQLDPAPPRISLGGPSYAYRGEPERSPLPRTAVRCVALNPTLPTELFACLADGRRLYRSRDGGESWEQVELGEGSAWTYTFAPSDPQVRYASFGPGDQSAEGGLYRTADAGQTWSPVGGDAITSTVVALAVHPADPAVLLAAASAGGLFRSDDGGDSWQVVAGLPRSPAVYAVAFAPSDPQIVYAAGEGALYRSDDGGLTWQVADDRLPVSNWQALAVQPDAPDTVLVGSRDFPQGGVYKRSDAAAPFALKADGMENSFVIDLEAAPDAPQTLYAATWGGGLFRSRDGGLTWEQCSLDLAHVFSLRALPGPDGGLLYAGGFYADEGLFRSRDGGDTWTQIGQDQTGTAWLDLQALGDDPDHLVAATSGGALYSHDAGQSWQASNLDQPVLRLCRFPDGQRTLAATYDSGLFYSRGGQSWYQANQGIDPTAEGDIYVYDLACSADVPGLAYATSQNVYRSRDYGESWEPVGSGLPQEYFRAIEIAPGGQYVVVGGDQSGVYVGIRGETWSAINTGLAEMRIRSLRVAGADPIQIWAGSQGGGVWTYTMTPRSATASVYMPFIRAAGPPGQAYEYNNSLAQARYLSLPSEIYSYLSPDEDEDFYRFDVRALGPITIGLEGIPAGLDYDLELYDGYRNLMGGSYWPSNHPERILFHPSRTGRYYVRIYSEGGSSPDQAYRLGLSQGPAQDIGQIYGTVTEKGEPAANVPVVLYYDNGYRSTRFSTLTDRSGVYRFQGLPSLPIGHTYTVAYPNYERQEQRLAFWSCQPITSYRRDQELAACSFDITNPEIESPAHQAVVTLPATFAWEGRSVPEERYQLRLRAASGESLWASQAQAEPTSISLSDLPAGLAYERIYRWDLLVYGEAGYGLAYYYREVTFSPTASEVKGYGPGEPNYPLGLRGELPPYPQTD